MTDCRLTAMTALDECMPNIGKSGCLGGTVLGFLFGFQSIVVVIGSSVCVPCVGDLQCRVSLAECLRALSGTDVIGSLIVDWLFCFHAKQTSFTIQ